MNATQKKLAFSSCEEWIDGETVETVSDFLFLGSKITTDGDCSHEIKRRLLLGRKVMTNLDCIFKSRELQMLVTGIKIKSTQINGQAWALANV